MRSLHVFSLMFCFLLGLPVQARLPYQDPALPTPERVRDLLSRMTLEEKVGQMVQLNFTTINPDGDPADGTEVDLDPALVAEYVRTAKVGSFLNGHAVPPRQWADYIKRLQTIALKESRLGIPIIYGVDHVHGTNYIAGGTVFPHNINLACSFDDELAREMGRVTAVEASPLGHHWIFAPVLDVGLNPYWPRFYETFGEEPRVAARMGSAFIEGLQTGSPRRPLAACAKHYLGYSAPISGWDRTPAHIPDQYLYEFFLPPFEAAVKSRVRTVMVNSGEVNGVPVHSSQFYLDEILRQRLGFEGVVVSDWEDVKRLHTMHNVARDEKEGALLAVRAGLDMAMTPYDTNFGRHVLELVREGALSESRVEESAARILALKFDLGLFEHPFPDPAGSSQLGSQSHRQQALRAARKTLVLLENRNQTLPLSDDLQRILLVGRLADSRRALAGGWTLGWLGKEESEYPASIITVAEAVRQRWPRAQVDVVENLAHLRFDRLADQADAIIAVVGEEPYAEWEGDIRDLSLPADQRALLEACADRKAPLTVVVLAGRPRLLGAAAGYASAVVFAGLPGFEGGTALAEFLAGDFSPSGRLAFSYPATPGHLTPYHHKPSEKSTARWPFGHGLSYGDYGFENLRLSSTRVAPGEAVIATVDLLPPSGQPQKRLQKEPQEQSVLWFLTDRYRSVTPSVRRLVHYQRVEASGRTTVSFTLVPERDLSFPDASGQSVLEPGVFELQVGELRAELELLEAPSSAGPSGP